jgi:hypothetical protein
MTLACAALAVLAAWSAAVGADTAQARQTVTIATPSLGADALSRTVQARVRVEGQVRRLRATVTTGPVERDVTRRFRRSGSEWTARLVVGRDLRPGLNGLHVRVTRPGGGTAVDSVHFRSVARRAPLVRSVTVRRGTDAPLVAGIALAKGVDSVRARLNGRDVRYALERTGPRARVARLAADDGLRFGRNRLLVTAIDRSNGTHQRVLRTFIVLRGCPLVGAGPDGVARQNAVIRLDGRSSRPHRIGDRVRLRWRIAAAPAASKARLRGARGARPRLVNAGPGVYEIVVRGSTPSGCATGATARAAEGAGAAGGPGPVAVGPSDRVTVAVQPDALPSGVPVQTIVSAAAPGIQVGPTFYPAGAGSVQMLVLDRTTLAPATSIQGGANQAFPGTDAGMQALSAAVPGSDEYIVLLGNPPGRSIQLSGQGSGTLQSVASGLGAQTLNTGGGNWATALAGGGWSLVGIPGLPQGQATSLFGLQQSADQPVGAMSGSFVIDSTGVNYQFTWPFTFTTFDTQAPGSSANQNVISVAGATYTSDVVPSGQSAFQVVALDAGTLALRSQSTIAVRSDPTALGSQLGALAGDAAPALVLVTSIGNPSVPQGASVDPAGWPAVAGAVDSLGGNPWALLALDGSGNYSLVGATALNQQGPNLGADLSQPVDPSAGSPRLAGTLQRGPQGTWQPAFNGSPSTATSPAAFQPEIAQVLAQPAQPFTPFPSGAQQAAEACINGLLGFGPLDPTWGIRANYWVDDDIVWATEQSSLRGFGSGACTGVPASAFSAVQSQLVTEFGQVARVRGYFTGGSSADLNGILTDAVADSSFGFDAVYGTVRSLYHPSGTARGPSGFSMLAAILSGGAPLFGELAPVVSIVAAAANIAGQVANAQSGASLVGATAFEAAAGALAGTLETNWQAAFEGLDHVADLFVSDAGRLQTAYTMIGTPGSEGGWGLDTASIAQLTNRLDRSIGQYMWYALLPTTLESYQCVVPAPASNWYEETNNTPSRARFPVVAAGSNYFGGMQIAPGFLSIAKPGGSDPAAPSQATLNTLFGTGNGQLGLQPFYFLRGATQAGGNRTSPGFSLNFGSFYDYSQNGFYLYDCAANSWQWNLD